MSSPRTFFILFFSVVLLGVSATVAWKGYEKYRENERVSLEVLKLQDEAKRLEGETAQLSDRIAYLRTPEYTEREVKEKLNLKKPDESVAIIQPGTVGKTPVIAENASQQKGVEIHEEKGVSNPMKWWNFFFAFESV